MAIKPEDNTVAIPEGFDPSQLDLSDPATKKWAQSNLDIDLEDPKTAKFFKPAPTYKPLEFDENGVPTTNVDSDIDELNKVGEQAKRGYLSGALQGFPGLASRKFMEWSGYKVPELKEKFPGQTEDWYKTKQKELITTSMTQLREELAQQQQEDPNTGASIVGGLAGSVGPETLINPFGGTVAARVASQFGMGGISDLAYQGADLADGVRKDVDLMQTLESAALGAGFQGVFEIPNFTKDLFRARGSDTTPKANPLEGADTPSGGVGVSGPRLTPDQEAEYARRLNEGSYHEIMDFVSDKPQFALNPDKVADYVVARDAGKAKQVGAGDVTYQGTGPEAPKPQVAGEAKTAQTRAVQEHIDDTTKDWKNKPDFEVVHSSDEIADPEIAAQAKAEGADEGALGFMGQDGKVRIFANNIKSPDQLSAVIYHEALGHYGLNQEFGDTLDNTLKDIVENNTGDFGDRVNDWLEENPEGYKNDPNRVLRAAEEVLAEQSESGKIDPKIFDIIANEIKKVGRKAGVDLKYSKREIDTILGMAHQAVVSGKGRNVIANGFRYMKVWHGTPHEEPFEKFDHSKMGSGEGAQVYGHGTYLTDVKNVADVFYRQRLAKQAAEFNGQKYDLGQAGDQDFHLRSDVKYKILDDNPTLDKLYTNDSTARRKIGGVLEQYLAEPSYFKDVTGRQLAEAHTIYNEKHLNEHPELYNEDSMYGQLAKAIRENPVSRTQGKGQLLEVEIPDDAKWLELDKYINEQPTEVQELFEDKLGTKYPLWDMTAKDAYNALARELGSPEAASKYLSDNGVTGNKYLTGQSRANGTGDYNYVVFDDNTPKITNRYMRVKPDIRDPGKYDVQSVKDTYEALTENYTPTYRSWAEAKRAASQQGLTANQIKKGTPIRALDQKLFANEQASRILDSKIADINDKIDKEGLTPKLKSSYLQSIAEYNYLQARIFDDQAEVGRALNAIKSLTFTKRKISELNKILEEQGGSMAVLADDETFLKFSKSVSALMEADNRIGASNALKQVFKPYWWQYGLSFRHNMMLSGMGTHAKNIADNALMIGRELEEATMALPGGVVRSGLRKAGAKNIQQGVSPEEVAGRLYGIMRAALDSSTYRDTAGAFKQGYGRGDGNSKLERQDPHIPVIGKVADALHAQDVFFRSFLNNANMYSIGVREARGSGLKGLRAFQDGTARAYSPTQSMLEEARRAADVALLVDSPQLPFGNAIELAKRIRPGMTGGEQFKAALANIAFPFFRVTDRLLFQKLRRSPLSVLDSVTREDWKAGGARRDIAIARTAFGSALIYYYWQQGDKVEGSQDNYKKQQALEAGGYLPNSVKDKDRYSDASALNLSANPFDLHNQIAADVATLRKAYKSGEDVTDGLIKATKKILEVMASSSFAENVTMYTAPFTGTEASKENAGKAVVANLAGSFVPAAVRQLNQGVLDRTKRDATGDKSLIARVYGRVASAIPGLSNKLPVKRDVYGNSQDSGKTLLAIRNFQKIKDDPVIVELQRLERTTDSPVVTAAPTYFKVDGETINLTGETYSEFQRMTGTTFIEAMNQYVGTSEWKALPDEEKITFIKKVRKEAAQAAKEVMLEGLTDNTSEEKEVEPE